MGLFSGVGKFVKRITTPPKGILRDVFGRSVLDEIGTGVGFALGGPAGSAIGRGLGKGAATGDVGKALGGAVEGYALGSLGAAAKAGLAGAGGGVMGGKTGAGAALQSLGNSAKPITSIGKGLIGNVAGMAGGAPAAGGAGGAPGTSGTGGTGGGGGASGLLGILSNPAALQGIGMLAGAGGAYMQGRSEDQQAKFAQDQIMYQRERNAQWDPMRMTMMNTLVSRLGGGAPAAPAAGQTANMVPSAPIPSLRTADTLLPPAGTIAQGRDAMRLPPGLAGRGGPKTGLGGGGIMPPSRPTDMGGMTPRPGGLVPTRPTTVPQPAGGMGLLGRGFEPTGVETRPSPQVPGMMGDEDENRIAALLARMGAASRGRMG